MVHTRKRKVMVFDDPRFIDRYTVIINNDVFTMSENPSHPQGVDMFSGKLKRGEITELKKVNLQVPIKKLPVTVQKAIKERMK